MDTPAGSHAPHDATGEQRDLMGARQGDQDAVVRLLVRYRPLLRGVSRRYFLPAGDADDLLQEATLGFIKAVRDYQPELGVPFRPFAELCATRQVISAVKAATRQKHAVLNTAVSLNRPRHDEGDGETLVDIVTDSAATPEDTLVRREEAAAVAAAIREILSPYERDVVRHYLQGRSFAEIAAACGTHPKSVDNALWRVKHKLRRYFLQLDTDDQAQAAGPHRVPFPAYGIRADRPADA